MLHKIAVNWDFALRSSRKSGRSRLRKQGREWRGMSLEGPANVRSGCL